jgi:zinc D-Ala-D-Ala carboxypeptidase
VWIVVAGIFVVAWFWSSTMKLSDDFDLSEFTRSDTASRLGINNTPNAEHVENLRALSEAVLQPFRDAVGKPVRITSGYRSAGPGGLNEAVNGAALSQHTTGQAADFIVDGLSAQKAADLIDELGLPYDQLIHYAASRGGHTHVSHRKSGNNRKQRLYGPPEGGYVAA